MKRKMLRAAGTFFVAMLIFTILSRAADSVNVIQIQTKAPQNQIVTHQVTGTGKVQSSEEMAVFVQENLQVEQVFVYAGQAVKKEDCLLKITEESIRSAKKELEDKAKVLEGQLSDLRSQKKTNDAKRASEQAWAGQSYDLALQSQNISVDNARAEVQIAQQRLDEFYREKEAAEEENGFTDGNEDADNFGTGLEGLGEDFAAGDAISAGETAEDASSSTEKALQDDLRGKQEVLNEAIAGRNQTMASAGKAVADANIAEPSDSTPENVKRELENVQEDLGKLENLENTQGNICAEADGMVKSLSVQTGDITGLSAAAVLYILNGDLRITGTISKENVKYVDKESEVEVTNNNNNDISDAKLEIIMENNDDNDIYDIQILIPEETLSIGQSADFSISKDAGPYECCVPLSALYEENGKNYVYVTDTENTVLGTVMVARKVEVSVKDKNQTVAALESGTVSSDQQVITWTSRELKDGSRVRLTEN